MKVFSGLHVIRVSWSRDERVVIVVNAAGALLFLSELGVEVVVEIAVQRWGPWTVCIWFI